MKRQAILATVTICVFSAIVALAWWLLGRMMAVETLRIDAQCTIYLGGDSNSVVLTSAIRKKLSSSMRSSSRGPGT